MKHATAKIAPKLQNFEQKQHRMDIAQEMLKTFKDDPGLLKNVITGDEAWVYGYDIESPKPNHYNESVQNSQDRKKHVKFGQM